MFSVGRNNEENSVPRFGAFNTNRGERNNEENNGQRPGGFPEQRSRSGFRGERNNEENGGQRMGAFNNNYRGGEFSEGIRSFAPMFVSVARNGDFQDRNNRYRNNQDEGRFNGERRDRNDGGFPRRGGFGDSRGGNSPPSV